MSSKKIEKIERDPQLGFIPLTAFMRYLQATCTFVIRGKRRHGKLTAIASSTIFIDGARIPQKDVDSLEWSL